jgi:hypothetical protein
VLNAITRANARKNGGFVVANVLRDQYRPGLADYFRCRIAKDALGASIPASDRTLQVLADDGVIGRVNDSRQMCKLLFG